MSIQPIDEAARDVAITKAWSDNGFLVHPQLESSAANTARAACVYLCELAALALIVMSILANIAGIAHVVPAAPLAWLGVGVGGAALLAELLVGSLKARKWTILFHGVFFCALIAIGLTGGLGVLKSAQYLGIAFAGTYLLKQFAGKPLSAIRGRLAYLAQAPLCNGFIPEPTTLLDRFATKLYKTL